MNKDTNRANDAHRKAQSFTLLAGLFFVVATFLTSVQMSYSGPIVWIEIGRASQNCKGFGICRGGVNAAGTAAVQAITQTGDGTLTLNFTAPLSQKGDLLSIDEAIRFDSATSVALGYKDVQIMPGAYPVSYAHNPNGEVQLAMQARGPIIWVEIGRRSAGCEKFGLCRGGVGSPDIMDRAVAAVAQLVNGKVQLDFLSVPPDAEAMMPIEEDIVLDSATSHVLGAKQLILARGTYPVDYAKNPYGTVEITTTTARGPIVWIKIGRPRKDCRGLGICAGGVGDVPTDALPVEAHALDNHTVQISFLTALPEQGNVFSIDDDILLDSSIAHVLGYGSVTILKGDYMIDRATNPQGTVTMNMLARGPIIWVEIGRKSAGCERFGFCRGGFGSPDLMDRAVRASVDISNGRLHLNFLSELPDKADIMPVDETVVLDSVTSRLFGYNAISILHGDYRMDYTKNPNGEVTMAMNARGPIIWVEIGRKSAGCERFGLCRGGIGSPALMDRSVRASVDMSNGQLHLNFLSELPDKADVMPVDEDIVFDHASSQALGYKSVVIAHGDYTVDYTKNPNGEVTMAMNARGPIIWVEIGRKSAGCERFGFCRGGVESASIEHGVQVEAEVSNGRLQVDFTSVLPEKETMLPVDEDIVLDSTASALLGSSQIVLRKGMYAVDYSGEGYGSVIVNVNSSTTGVAMMEQWAASFAVYPNPAGSMTTITFNLAHENTGTLTVVNHLGQYVGTVHQGYTTQGIHTIQYSTDALPAGMYYLHLSSGTMMQSIPLIVVH